MVMESLNAYLAAGKAAIEIFKAVRAELPKGEASDKAALQIERAETALKTSEAELAKQLGFRLCRCSFPPEIMLWNKDERASFCPKCNDRNPPKKDAAEDHDSWAESRFM